MDPVERIRLTMTEVGHSISLTTITTAVAFVLGCISSSVPAIQWLCLYAIPTICIDFVYQITFFVAILVLDEQRIKANRRDCCICITVPPETDEKEVDEGRTLDNTPQPQDVADHQIQLADRVMVWYSNQLLRPYVKVTVLFVFALFLGACIYSTTLLEQEFKPSDFLPDGSYAYAFIDNADKYTTQKLRVSVFFRDVDQSDPAIRSQMIDYINDLAAMSQIQSQPDFCWVTAFQELQDGTNPVYKDQYSYVFNSNMTFSQQLDLLLSVPEIRDLYGDYFARTETGEIVASKCTYAIRNLDLNDVKDQIKMLSDQRAVSAAQPINQGRSKFAFFSLDKIYFLWVSAALLVRAGTPMTHTARCSCKAFLLAE